MVPTTLRETSTNSHAEPASTCVSNQQRAALTSALLHRARGEPCAVERRRLLNQVVLVNRPVAEGVASGYRNRGVPHDDLLQIAYEGLTKAVLRFDPDLGHDLLTYAVPTIRGELQRYLRDQGWSVRPPRRVVEVQQRIISTTQALTQQLGREPCEEEIRAELGMDAAEYAEALVAFSCKQATSLDRPVGVDHDEPLGSLVADEDRGRSAAEARLLLAPVLRSLADREREILYLRFFEDLTQQEIGERLGVTQMQVSRLLTQILSGLRARIAA